MVMPRTTNRGAVHVSSFAPKGILSTIRDHAGECALLALPRAFWVLLVTGVAAASLFAALLVVLRFVNPPVSSFMAGRWLAGASLEQRWVPLSAISPHLIKAVIVSEDGQFCRHRGVDFRELEAALRQAENGALDQVRGASTITMQVAKNLFLWPSKDFVRKGLELGMALMMDGLWPKERVLEVYLNIAEWGPGIFGAEAAARYHFRKPALRLNEREAALLAASLPNPIKRSASRPGPGLRHLAQVVQNRAQSAGQRASCILAKGVR
jgi:monofunctional biosynthetic peptidoglycan transglycosylase